jgi:DNA (cytosine-5)-methyltransferase 1
MEAEGYTVWPFVVPACAVAAPHRRDRLWIVANAGDGRRSGTDNREVEQQRRAKIVCRGDATAHSGCEW